MASLPAYAPAVGLQASAVPAWRVTAAAVWECVAGWCLAAAVGLLVFLVLLVAVQRQEMQALQDARLEITLREWRERLEAELALGWELHQSASAQSLLEEALAREAGLIAAEVFDASGTSLFNTDRGAMGEQVPASWLKAGRSSAAGGWSVDLAGDRTLGLAVRGPFGELAGFVCATQPAASPLASRSLLLATALVSLTLGLLAWGAVRRALQRHRASVAIASAQQAAAQLATAQHRMDQALAALAFEEAE